MQTQRKLPYTKKARGIILASISLLFAASLPLNAASDQQRAEALWEKLSPYFTPPAEFVGVYGDFRSPLFFENGEKVRTPEEWQERRQEILDLWHGWMGEWPPLNTEQELEILSEEPRENFTQKRIRFQWTPNETTEGYLLIPEGEGPHPAVVAVFYEPETAAGIDGRPYRDYAYQLVKRGFVTLSIGTTEATAARTYALYHPSIDNAEIEGLSMLAHAAANAWHALAKRPEVDEERIGIAGHSFGGKWAMFASALFDKYAAAAWSDPGIVFDTRPSVNYWEPWYLGYHQPPWRKRGVITEENPAFGLYLELLEKNRDLHEIHALMAPRPFLVSAGSEDPPERWKALNHTIAINDLLGYSHRVGMQNRPEHSPDAESHEIMLEFFEYFLLHRGVDLKHQPEVD
ncbi:MAG TPA: prolyl oligopeptidase family serine peptidase [Opitutales bacterium]|nr:prolyl oligopeptidase family serine peptidase [Opitutales bacterium]